MPWILFSTGQSGSSWRCEPLTTSFASAWWPKWKRETSRPQCNPNHRSTVSTVVLFSTHTPLAYIPFASFNPPFRHTLSLLNPSHTILMAKTHRGTSINVHHGGLTSEAQEPFRFLTLFKGIQISKFHPTEFGNFTKIPILDRIALVFNSEDFVEKRES